MGKYIEKAKFIEKTKEDSHICPFCGSGVTECFSNESDKNGIEISRYRCPDCCESYDVDFDVNERIVDICNHNRFSLMK